MRATGIAMLVAATMSASPVNADLLRKRSPHPVKETVDRLEAIVTGRGLQIVARVDHAAGANKVGLELRPTELLIFGSPATGTPLMQTEQTMGLSLPLKILVWQDAENNVWLGYDTPLSIAAERGLAKDNPVLGKVGEALAAISDAAVKP